MAIGIPELIGLIVIGVPLWLLIRSFRRRGRQTHETKAVAEPVGLVEVDHEAKTQITPEPLRASPQSASRVNVELQPDDSVNSSESRRLVFVSHATPDRDEADRIVAQLENVGITCWTAPRNVSLGSNYAESIVNAIEQAELMLLLLSAHANASPHVANEIERAVNYRKRIVPVRLDDTKPSRSIELHVSTRQWVEMWGTAERCRSGMSRLVTTLRDTLRDQIVLELPSTPVPGALTSSAHRAHEETASQSGSQPDPAGSDGPVESDHTELEILAHDGTTTALTDPTIAYSGGFGPSNATEGIAVRRGIEQSVLAWSRLRTLTFRSRQEKNDKGTVVWRHSVAVVLSNDKPLQVELQDDWNMAYMGGGGTGLLFGQTDLGEVKVPFTSISVIKILKYARPGK